MMKSKGKIVILSKEEMMRETLADSARGRAGNCGISQVCKNGKNLQCSGARCEEIYANLEGGLKEFVGLKCYDENDRLIYNEYCETSGSGSGVSGITDEQIRACSGASEGMLCEWRDSADIRHVGRCAFNLTDPRALLYCMKL